MVSPHSQIGFAPQRLAVPAGRSIQLAGTVAGSACRVGLWKLGKRRLPVGSTRPEAGVWFFRVSPRKTTRYQVVCNDATDEHVVFVLKPKPRRRG